MTPEGPGSVSHWIGGLKAGDGLAAQRLWERYFDRLVRMARKRLVAARRTGGDADEEDAALSAFDSFCGGAARGRFPLLSDREDLWRLLVLITARKAADQAQRRRALKRGGDRSPWGGAEDGPRLNALVGREPSPEFAALVADEYRRLLDRLGDESLKAIALKRMEGYTVDEIAGQLGCARRTVARRLDLIRTLWTAEGD